MSKAKSKTMNVRHVKGLLVQLQKLDQQASKAYYEIGQILSAFDHGELYLHVGYDTLDDMIEEELSFSASRGRTYMGMFRKFNALGYSKGYALELLFEFGLTKMLEQLFQDEKPIAGISWVRIDYWGKATGKTGRSYKKFTLVKKPAPEELQIPALASERAPNAENNFEDDIPF